MRSSRSALRWMMSRYSTASSSSSLSSDLISSAKDTMEVSGVRSSWLTVAR